MSPTKKTVTKRNAPQSITAVAAEAKGLVTQASTVLAAGEPLSAKARKEVIIRSIRTTPALVTAAAAAYTEHASVLGGDLDVAGALAAQDFVVEMTPVVTAVRTLAQALEDRIHEHDATASAFAQTVYERARAMQKMPNGTALAPRVEQLEELQVRPKRKPKGKTEEAPPTGSNESTADGVPATAAAAPTPTGQSPSVVVNASKA